jgi:hypothetical protein
MSDFGPMTIRDPLMPETRDELRDQELRRLRAEVAAVQLLAQDSIADADRLRELLRDVAASGVEYEALRYFVIQIDKSTWLDVIAALGGEKKDEA